MACAQCANIVPDGPTFLQMIPKGLSAEPKQKYWPCPNCGQWYKDTNDGAGIWVAIDKPPDSPLTLLP